MWKMLKRFTTHDAVENYKKYHGNFFENSSLTKAPSKNDPIQFLVYKNINNYGN